jgi:hypothetical protein
MLILENLAIYLPRENPFLADRQHHQEQRLGLPILRKA